MLSALGIGLADVVRHRSCGIERPLDADVACRSSASSSTRWSAKRPTKFARRRADEQIAATRSLDVRYQGVDSYLTIRLAGGRRFRGRVRRRASAAVRLHARRPAAGDRGGARRSRRPRGRRHCRRASERPHANADVARHGRRVFRRRPSRHAAVRARANLVPGDRIVGPAIVTRRDFDDGDRTGLAGGGADAAASCC